MDFRLLGPLEVETGDGLLALGGARQRAVLALLLLDANRVVPRERLIHDLWGDRPPETAVATLQAYVSRLRKQLPDVLLSRPPGYVLVVDADADSSDLLRFESLVAKAREADAKTAAALLREALGLWRGPALAEFASVPFAEVEAARLEGLRLAALEERIDADLALGRHGVVISELETVIAEHPYRERLRGQLMVALYRSGRQAEALEAFRSARDALDELGIEPSAELRELEKAILVQDRALAARSQVVEETFVLPGPLVPAPSSPFVGREAELAGLRSQLERAREGEGSLVLLASQAGGGKTRLVREVALEAAANGALVLYGSSSATITVPFQAVREWLEFALRVTDPQTLEDCVGDGGELLARLVPEFAVLGRGSGQATSDAVTDPYLLQRAVTEFLVRLSRLRPLLLVADDLHWADSGTLQLVSRLARTAPEARMVVVAAFRDRGEEPSAELSETLAELSRLAGVMRLPLGDLSSEEVRAFVRASTDAEAAGDLVSTIGELTSGTPLLVCELWRDLVAAGDVDVSDAGVQLARPVSSLRGSERIQDVVRHRWSRLSGETGGMLELAAVAGPRFELRLLADAAGLGRAAVVASVEEAIAIGMLEELPDREPACRFSHELVRRAIYDEIRRVRRPELHLQVGEALERIHALDLDAVLPELAYHFMLAAPLAGVERGVDYNLRAAEAAKATSAYDEAAARMSSALELGIADRRERARVQAELGQLLYFIGRTGESEAVLSASLDAATGLDEPGLALRVLLHRTAERLSSDPDVGSDEIVPIAEEAIRELEQLGDSLGLAAAESLLGGALAREGRSEESAAALNRALVHAEAAGDQVTRRDVIGRMGLSLCDNFSPVGEAIQRIDELRRSALGDRVLDAGLCRCRALLLAMAGRFEEAHELLVASGPILDGADQSLLSLNSRYMVAEIKDFGGDPVGARQDLVAVFLRMRDARGEGVEARALRAAADVALRCCDLGDWDEAADYLAYGQEVDRSEPPQGKVYAILRLAAQGRLAAHRGEIAEGIGLAQRAVELADRGQWVSGRARARLALVEVQRANGQNAEADATFTDAVRLYAAKGNVAAIARLRDGSGERPQD